MRAKRLNIPTPLCRGRSDGSPSTTPRSPYICTPKKRVHHASDGSEHAGEPLPLRRNTCLRTGHTRRCSGAGPIPGSMWAFEWGSLAARSVSQKTDRCDSTCRHVSANGFPQAGCANDGVVQADEDRVRWRDMDDRILGQRLRVWLAATKTRGINPLQPICRRYDEPWTGRCSRWHVSRQFDASATRWHSVVYAFIGRVSMLHRV
jgi:hypothetical protein